MELPEELKKRVVWDKDAKKEHVFLRPVDYFDMDPAPCPDCGKVVKNRRIYHKVYFSPFAHWRHQCLNCKKYKNPTTGIWDVTTSQVQKVFIKFLKALGK